jgi:hypothetical protein
VGQSPTGEKNVSTEADDIVEICHQATTGENTADMQSMQISDGAVVTCNYGL